MHILAINKNRKSGIELLKVLALFGIVMCHTYTSFSLAIDEKSGVAFFDEYYLSTIEYFIFQIVITFGYLGNMIFFVCTSWFLCDQKESKREKIIYIIICAIIISIIYIIIDYLGGGEITAFDIFKAITPISSQLYWYMTAYVMMYFIFPYLNNLFVSISKKEHFVLAIFVFTIYYLISYFTNRELFFTSKIIDFISAYIIVSYIKKYHYEICDNIRINTMIFIITSLAFYTLIFINFAIVPIELEWHKMYNPFFLIMSFSALNIVRKINFKSSLINTVSAMSMFIYMFHASYYFNINIIDKLSSIILNDYGLNYIVPKIFLTSLIVFILAFSMSLLFNLLFRKFAAQLSENLKNKISTLIDTII